MIYLIIIFLFFVMYCVALYLLLSDKDYFMFFTILSLLLLFYVCYLLTIAPVIIPIAQLTTATVT